MADLVFIRGLVYFGEQVARAGRLANLRRYVDAVLALDPHFRDAYKWAGVVTMYNTGAITLEEVEASIHYLERGVRVFADDAELAYILGFNLYFELPPLLADEERAERARQQGIEELRRAASMGGGPEFLSLAVASLLSRQGDRQLAYLHLASVYSQIEDPELREQIRLRLAELQSQAEAEAFVEAVESAEERWQAEFPYVPFSMYLLMGPRLPSSGSGARASSGPD